MGMISAWCVRRSISATAQDACAHVDRNHGAAQRVVPRQHVSNARRQTQDPLHPTAQSPRGGDPGLADRHGREHAIDQVRRPIGHPSPAAARAEPAPLARERDQPIETAAGAAEPREARCQAAARQALAIAHAGSLGAEGLEVIADQLMQGTVLGSARPIDGGGGGHAARKRKART